MPAREGDNGVVERREKKMQLLRDVENQVSGAKEEKAVVNVTMRRIGVVWSGFPWFLGRGDSRSCFVLCACPLAG